MTPASATVWMRSSFSNEPRRRCVEDGWRRSQGRRPHSLFVHGPEARVGGLVLADGIGPRSVCRDPFFQAEGPQDPVQRQLSHRLLAEVVGMAQRGEEDA